MEPTTALRRIAYLLEREGAESYKVRAFRNAAVAVDDHSRCRAGRRWDRPACKRSPEWARPAPRSSPKRWTEGPRPTSRSWRRWSRPPSVPTDRRCWHGSRATATAIRTGRTEGARSTRWPEAAQDLGHRYWALTDHSPRLTVAHGLDPERLRQQLDVVARTQRGAGPIPDPHRDRSRHPGGRIARPGRGHAGAARRGGRQRAFEAAHGGGGDDGADGAGHREPAHRHPRALHRAASWSGGAVRSRPSTPRPCSRPAPHRYGGRDQLPARAARPARAAARLALSPVASWWWTPTPMPPVSSNGSATVASRRRVSGCRWKGS